MGEPSGESPRPRVKIWEVSPIVYSNYENQEIFDYLMHLLGELGIDTQALVFTGFDGGRDVARVTERPRAETFGVTTADWAQVLADPQPAGMFEPIQFMEAAETPCIGVYDAAKLRCVVDGAMIDSEIAMVHETSDNVQDALLGVFVFKKF